MAPQREWFEKDYYSILGVAVNTDQKEITKAYRKLARQFHPDANPDNPAAEEQFKEVSAAYGVLSDEQKRAEYDQVRTVSGSGAGGFGGGGANMGDAFSSDDLGGLFGNLFGSTTAGRPAGPRRGDDLETSARISFLDSLQGVTTNLTLITDALCGTCSGSGCVPGTSRTVCMSCGGQGTATSNQGFFSFAKPCMVCGGQGNVPQVPCITCAGSGVSRLPKEIKVRIPAGVDDGQKIRLKSQGAPGRHGAAAGDLYINVEVQPDGLFERDNRNLKLVLPVTFTEATLGTTLKVPTPTTDHVTINIPPGSQSGKTLRVKGHGVKTKKYTGDLLVTLQVVTPEKLTDEQRDAVNEMKKLFPEKVRTGRLDQ